MITTADYAALRAARATLDSTANALTHAARLADSTDATAMTRVAMLCEIAEDAIFSALVTAAVYLDDPQSGAALFACEPS
jgi:hypothetical protein